MTTVVATCNNTYNYFHKPKGFTSSKFCAHIHTDFMFPDKQNMSSNNIKCQSSHENVPTDGDFTNPYLNIYGPQVVFSSFLIALFVFLCNSYVFLVFMIFLIHIYTLCVFLLIVNACMIKFVLMSNWLSNGVFSDYCINDEENEMVVLLLGRIKLNKDRIFFCVGGGGC